MKEDTVLDRIDIPEVAPDRVYRSASGSFYRARVARVEAPSIKAAPNANPALIAATDIVLSVSLAVVDEQGYVQLLGDKLRISDRHEIGPLTAAAMADLPALIDATIEIMIVEADETLSLQPEALAFLAREWGIDRSVTSTNEG